MESEFIDLKGLTCLVVDDDDAVRRSVVRTLEALGVNVVEASSAEAAAMKFDGARPIDVVLSDVSMPGGDSGIELVKAIREIVPSMPCVVMSGFSKITHSAESDVARSVKFISKPFRREAIAEALRESIRLVGSAG